MPAKPKPVPLACPQCHADWADITYYNPKTGEVRAKDIVVKLGDKKFKDGDELGCTICGYRYTTWDLFIAIGTATSHGKAQ